MNPTSALWQADIAVGEAPDDARPFKVYTQRDLDRIAPLGALPDQVRFEMRVVSSVLPFR